MDKVCTAIPSFVTWQLQMYQLYKTMALTVHWVPRHRKSYNAVVQLAQPRLVRQPLTGFPNLIPPFEENQHINLCISDSMLLLINTSNMNGALCNFFYNKAVSAVLALIEYGHHTFVWE